MVNGLAQLLLKHLPHLVHGLVLLVLLQLNIWLLLVVAVVGVLLAQVVVAEQAVLVGIELEQGFL
jgi:hypothetical protein